MTGILFTGGGSAGHVVPNLAIMHELRYSCRLSYMGTCGIERELVEREGYPFFRVDTPKLVRSFTAENFKIPLRLFRARRRALEIVSRERPDLVFSKGGFASYPAVWAAHRCRIPVLTHESDLTPGLCTRLIAKKCALVLTAFEETAARFPNGKYVGAPVRRSVLSGDRARARAKYGFPAGLPVLLVLGGGSGSRALNEALRARLHELLPSLCILHLCGKGNLMPDPPEGYVQREYETDMGSAYACADVVLCRAGSNTAFEALALKKRVLFVPLARASRGDQLENALYFARRGWCRVLLESELSSLPAAIAETLSSEPLCRALAACPVGSATPAIVSLIKAYRSPKRP